MGVEKAGQGPRWKRVIDLGLTVAMVILAVVIVWQNFVRAGQPARPIAAAPQATVPKAPITIRSPLVIGSPAATIGIVEFADFECAFCAKFSNEVKPRLIKEYVDTGKVFLAFRNYPLKFHKRAVPAALAAGCAARQGKYWEMFDYLFGGPDRLEDSGLEQAGRAVGLRMPEYAACRSDAAMLQEVNADKALGDEFVLSGTPTFFFGKRTEDGALSASVVLAGARPYDEFKAILDKMVAGLQ